MTQPDLASMGWPDRLRWARESGISQAHLARLVGVTRFRVAQVSKAYGIALPPANARPVRGILCYLTAAELADYRVYMRKHYRRRDALIAVGRSDLAEAHS